MENEDPKTCCLRLAQPLWFGCVSHEWGRGPRSLGSALSPGKFCSERGMFTNQVIAFCRKLSMLVM